MALLTACSDMQLREIMQDRVVTIRPTESATAAWTRMRRRDIRHLVVVDGARIVGVLSERDLGGRDGGGLRRGRSVRDLMSRRVVSVAPDITVRRAADFMRRRLIGSLPVVEGDQLVGIVTASDVFDALGREVVGPLSRAERQLLRAPATSKSLGGRPVARPRSHAPDEAARERRPAPRSEEREPFAARVPRPARRQAGRTAAPQVPANIRVTGVELDEDERASIRKRLGARLGKFATSIERVTVRVRDVNGPRGGVDTSCRIKVVLSGLPSVVVEERAASLESAIAGAIAGTERAVRRSVLRRRETPIRSAARKRPRASS